jgi:hypothetical protein
MPRRPAIGALRQSPRAEGSTALESRDVPGDFAAGRRESRRSGTRARALPSVYALRYSPDFSGAVTLLWNATL